jgi:N-acetylmuramic acid 6-phosphate etherase
MLQNLTTEGRNPASEGIDTLSALEIVRLMNREDRDIANAVAEEAATIARAVDLIADKMQAGGRLLYLGAGTSGRLGVLDATECPPTFNTPPELVVGVIAGGYSALTRSVEGAEDHPEFGAEDLKQAGLTPRDVVVGIATSGRTPYVVGGLKYARELGASTIGYSCNPAPEFAAVCDLSIVTIVGPEVISGSTRLKAGTATKMVLNILSTGAMVRLGKTYGNLMVDLRATNQKLLDRTIRIVMTLTGLTDDAAFALLQHCDGELKTSVVAHAHGIDATAARDLLASAGGHLRRALHATPMLPNPKSGPAPFRSEPVPATIGADLVLGIDGGGSKTVALLARRQSDGGWSLVGRGASGASNPQAVGFAAAFQSLDKAIDGAFADARLPVREVAAVCGALAGAERESDRRQVAEWARRRQLARQLQLVHDALPLLAAGTPAGWGVALIAGTGSFSFGQDATGKSARAGGWGHLLGDEGSGYILARQALQAAVQAADGRAAQTTLLPRLLEKFQLIDPLDLIGKVYDKAVDRPTIASWSDLVFEEAAAGDTVSQGIVAAGARELAEVVASVCRQIGFETAPFPLAVSGGLLIHHATYREALERELNQRGFRPDPIGIVPDPVVGSLVLAQRSADATSS